MKAKLLISAVAATFMMTASLASAGTIVYASGTFGPWGNSTNDVAMDAAFGVGNWLRFSTYTADMFTGADFVFLDGSDFDANEFSSFLAANRSVIANYVSNGGHLFLNSAPNEGSSYDMGFDVTLNYPAYSGSANVTAAGVAAGLTAGGLTTDYLGNFFSHGAVSGGGISDLIHGTAGTIFGAKNVDAGFVAFGGQTTTNFHIPSTDAQALLVNELRYVANLDNHNEVPEPASLALFGLGMAGVAVLRRRKPTN